MFRSLVLFQIYGMTPPLAFGWLSFRSTDFRFFIATEFDASQVLLAITVGLVTWYLGSRILWVMARNRLAKERIDSHDDPLYAKLGPELVEQLAARRSLEKAD